MNALNRIFILASIPAALLLASCEGRTDNNVQPTGDTIEVIIPSADAAADSIIANTGQIPDALPASDSGL